MKRIKMLQRSDRRHQFIYNYWCLALCPTLDCWQSEQLKRTRMRLFVVVILACCNIMITCILTLFIIYQSQDRLQVLNRTPFLFTGWGVCVVMQNMTMESSGLIDQASARGQVMFLPGIKAAAPGSLTSALVNHSVGGMRRRGGRIGTDVVVAAADDPSW